MVRALSPCGGRENGLEMTERPCGRGGHNNIKSNPVFRGMGGLEFQLRLETIGKKA